jgi:hypothetical protein
MAVIFLGATTPAADWPLASVVALGTGTGLAAGAVLGLVTGWFLPTLAGPSPLNRAVLAILTSRGHRLLGRSMVGLRVRGVRTGRYVEFPVMYAGDASRLVVFPGRPESKRWWRNLSESAEVGVMLLGRWSWGTASLLQPEDPGYDAAVETYARRWPRVRVPRDARMVVVRITPP